MSKTSGLWLLFILVCMTSACGNKQNNEPQDTGRHSEAVGETYVDTMVLRTSHFDRQTVCNGHLRAVAVSELNFLKPGMVDAVLVHDGQRVAKGALIATLDRRECRREVEKAEHELERLHVQLVDYLIGQGYNADLKGVPADVMRRAEITSGYYSAKYNLQTARATLRDASLCAPFSGRIADVTAHAHQTNDKICTLIDDSQFDVEFKVLEAELPHLCVGQTVKVTPLAADSTVYEGRVTAVNPKVDDKGLVKLIARIKNRGGRLLDGMNVRVVAEKRVDNMFVVPKDAVVERDGYHVLFRYVDGKAVWTYVDVLHANISSYAVTGCQRKGTTLKVGDIVITSGNLNLADGTLVKLQ